MNTIGDVVRASSCCCGCECCGCGCGCVGFCGVIVMDDGREVEDGRGVGERGVWGYTPVGVYPSPVTTATTAADNRQTSHSGSREWAWKYVMFQE